LVQLLHDFITINTCIMNHPAYNPDWTTAQYLSWNSKLTRRGMELKAERGEYPSAAPLGYRNVRTPSGSRLELDPETAPLIRDAFKLFNEGHSVRKILAVLTEQGLRSRRGKCLRPSALYHILHNPLYRGHVMWNGRTIQGVHPPLAPEEDQ